jgi:phosphoribosylamine--glycine ligase
MKVLIFGSGGREHALGWAIQNGSPDVELHFSPGNPGTARIGRNLSGDPADASSASAVAREVSPDLIVIGPEVPLVAGVADVLRENGFAVFGPSQRAAQIEGSKVYAKTLMREHGIPTAAFEVFNDPEPARRFVQKGLYPKVVKADGLAGGKGAIVVRTPDEGTAAVSALMESDRFGEAGKQILIESFLDGEEVSAFAIASDEQFALLPLAQDHKRIGEGDTGPNTGGMGAYAPFARSTPELEARIRDQVIGPTLRALAQDGRPFRGLLFAGLMVSDHRISALEFNCRFGDPETQAIMLLLQSGAGGTFLDALSAAAAGRKVPAVPVIPGAAATVVLASHGYPDAYRVGLPIRGIERAEQLPDTWVFHAGTKSGATGLVTAGGRVLSVSARGADLRSALGRAYEAASLIEFEGKTFRRDIGARGLGKGGA